MRTGRPKARLTISPSERKRLEAWTGRRMTAQALALRARIVLLCGSGMQNIDVAEKLGVSKQMVGKWRHRFVERRLDVHLVMDNHATHKTPAIRRWLAQRPRFHVHFTPTGASWINMVERWFATLTAKQLRRGTHRSTRQLEAAIKDYIAIANEDPKPFVWTKTADEILESIKRFCMRTAGTGH